MRLALLLLCALLFPREIVAQVSAATDAVGFVSSTVAAGSAQAIGLPLDNPPDYVAAATNVGSTTLQTASANWTPNAFGPFDSNPHIVRVLTGASKGREFRITGNSSDTVSLLTNGADLSTFVSTGDRYAIIAVRTLASFFGANAPSLNDSSDPEAADNVLIRGARGWLTYYNDGNNWLRAGGGTDNENARPLLPQNGLLLVRSGATDYSVSVSGSVPATELKTDLRAGRVTLLANRFPVTTTLDALGLAQTQGWRSNIDPALADNVLLRDASGWLTYFYDGSQWLRAGQTNTSENPVIPVGAAMLVVRRSGSDITLDQQPPF